MTIVSLIAITYAWISFLDMRRDLSQVYREAEGNKWMETGKAFLSTVLTCGRCFAFWLSLILTQDVAVAAVCSLVYDLYDRIRLKLT